MTENKKIVLNAPTSKTVKRPFEAQGQCHYNISSKKGQQKFKLDFSKINEEVRIRFPGLVFQLLPHGRKEGNEWLALNPTRVDRHIGSFHVNLQTWQFYDFATGEGGTGAIALYAYIKGLSYFRAAKDLNNQLKGNKND